MRGIYTGGVLEYFAEQNLYFPYNIGVSAGACMSVSYLSRQNGRNKVVNIDYVKDPRYISWRNLIRKREMFGMDFIFDEIPNTLVPFDYKAFQASPEELVVGTTDLQTGEPLYFYKSESDFDMLKVLRASSSLPIIAPVVEYKDRLLMDGGISDPIPLRKAEQDGQSRNVLILTRNKEYRKSPTSFSWLIRRSYRRFPEFVKTLLRRHEVYNETMSYIDRQESNGSAFVIRPQIPLTVGRMERDPKKLEALYLQGYEDAKRMLPALKEWMGKSSK